MSAALSAFLLSRCVPSFQVQRLFAALSALSLSRVCLLYLVCALFVGGCVYYLGERGQSVAPVQEAVSTAGLPLLVTIFDNLRPSQRFASILG